MHGGVTTMISAGEVHTPGRPKDVVGLKAMAVFAQRAFTAFRPGGVKYMPARRSSNMAWWNRTLRISPRRA